MSGEVGVFCWLKVATKTELHLTLSLPPSLLFSLFGNHKQQKKSVLPSGCRAQKWVEDRCPLLRRSREQEKTRKHEKNKKNIEKKET